MSAYAIASPRHLPRIAVLALICVALIVAAAPLPTPGLSATATAATKGRRHPRPSPTPLPTPVPAPGGPGGPPHPPRILPPDPCAPFRRAGAALADPATHGTPAAPRWRRTPPALINPHRRYLLDLRIGLSTQDKATHTLGTVIIQLDPLHNPRTVNAFLFLVCNGYYRDATLDRLIPGSLVEGASPAGIAAGGPGFALPTDPVHAAYHRGVVALVDSGPNAAAGRFLILLDTLVLPPHYTIFARVVGRLDVLDTLSNAPTTDQPDAQEPSLPLRPPRILSMGFRIITSR